MKSQRLFRSGNFLFITVYLAVTMFGCTNQGDVKNEAELEDFADRYAAAWGSQDAASVAAFFTVGGSLQINDGEPSVGRDELTAVAQSFMTTLPDMVLLVDSLAVGEEGASFYWTLIATNSGPGGNGNPVKISGYEEWILDSDGFIEQSLGHMDTSEYERQLEFGYEE